MSDIQLLLTKPQLDMLCAALEYYYGTELDGYAELNDKLKALKKRWDGYDAITEVVKRGIGK